MLSYILGIIIVILIELFVVAEISLSRIQSDQIVSEFVPIKADKSLLKVSGIIVQNHSDSIWPLFRRNLLNSGSSTAFSGVKTSELKWLYNVNPNKNTTNSIRSPATIDSNGTIYFGSASGEIFAVNSTGSRLWVFRTGGDVRAGTMI